MNELIQNDSNSTRSDIENHSLQILSFMSQKVRLCAEIKYIDKVIQLVRLEPVPGSPTYLVGLLNLAGESIPIIDLALRLNLQRSENYSLDTPILISKYAHKKMGILVDNIMGLTTLKEKNLQIHEEFKHENSPFLAAANVDNELALLINMPFLISGENKP